MKNNPFYSILPIAVTSKGQCLIENIGDSDYEIKYAAFYNPSTSTDVSELDAYDTIAEIENEYDTYDEYAETLMDVIYEHLDIDADVSENDDLFTEDIILALCGWSKTTLRNKAENTNMPLSDLLRHEMETDCEPFYKKGRSLLRAMNDMSNENIDKIISMLTNCDSLEELYGEGAPLLYVDPTHTLSLQMHITAGGNAIYTVVNKLNVRHELAPLDYATIKDALNAVKNIPAWEAIEDKIDALSQKELRFDTDHITNKGWNYIETTAPKLCLTTLIKRFDNPSKIEEDEIEECFNDILEKSEYKLREHNN